MSPRGSQDAKKSFEIQANSRHVMSGLAGFEISHPEELYEEAKSALGRWVRIVLGVETLRSAMLV